MAESVYPVNNEAAVFALHFTPCIYYLSLMQKEKDVCFDICENFPRQSFRSRAVIAMSHGVYNMIVPTVRNKGEKTPVKDTLISYSEKWNYEMWHAIYTAYGKSPYFEYYDLQINRMLMKRHKFLIDLNFEMLEFLKKSMSLDFNINVSDRYIERTEDNYRDILLPKERCDERYTKTLKPYFQCFESLTGFQPNLSALDLLFALGPESKDILL